ncbi:hypothetical protein [Gleimia europaea]|uniref:Uncharacterized protein n=1 Tax=Gleimia europaea ACS-120-V-Col10b TaxID=883069 RepID=A0A9W5RDR3_9ACTO|nr:hypothetical protein [Gleimia europaea]EPD30608.1 hypothetical protein HMPREF9238_00354 [Gleimia europaea ACS-120-V-Col10b]
MRRYTDFFVMLALLVLDFLIAVIMWNTVDDALNPNSTSLGYMIMSLTLIAIPGIAMAAGLALGRATWNLAPRSFYLVVLLGSGLSAGLTWVASLALDGAGAVVSFGNAIFAMVVLAVASLVGLILGLTGAVPTAKVFGASLKDSAKQNEDPKPVDSVATVAGSDADGLAALEGDDVAPGTQTPGTAASASPRKVIGGNDAEAEAGEESPSL